eukprot:CCRYP_007941-RA/>CCRYP_007941-RA protein AED:0.24 eAED:0.26 QI:0/0/0/1/1/1/2/0/192
MSTFSPLSNCARVSFSRKPVLRASSQSKSNEFSHVAGAAKPAVVPRAAVSVVSPTRDCGLSQGKIEVGESTLDAAKRELWEETGLLSSTESISQSNLILKWHNNGPFTCTDSIHHSQSYGVSFHYVISQCFAELQSQSPPIIQASDDAMDARWWSAHEMKDAEERGVVTKGVMGVLERSEALYISGLLKCEG